MRIVHSENSTTQPEWHPNAVKRGTWAIYQTCVITIFLCVWTTIHLNIPRPYEKSSSQRWRKITWSLLTIIAPEYVALNAWFQYHDAKALLEKVNETRPPKESYFRHCLNVLAFACFAPLRILDWLRISRLGHLLVRLGLVRDRSQEICDDERYFAYWADVRREARVQASMEDAKHTWTLDMAFYVRSGGCVYRGRDGRVWVLSQAAIVHLSKYEPLSLVPIQRAVLQNPGKANTIGKAITCIQAFWFCMQCITRIIQGLATSLLEVNTFSHCISALIIYVFWWHKPYDVESYVFIESPTVSILMAARQEGLRPLQISTTGQGNRRLFTGTLLILDENGNRLLRMTVGDEFWNDDEWDDDETDDETDDGGVDNDQLDEEDADEEDADEEDADEEDADEEDADDEDADDEDADDEDANEEGADEEGADDEDADDEDVGDNGPDFQLPPTGFYNTPNPKLKIPGTRLYVTFDLPDQTFNESEDHCKFDGEYDEWQKFWHAWLDLGCPIPAEPVNLEELWFRPWSASMISLGQIQPGDRFFGRGQLTIRLIMVITFACYGGLHLLGWQYSFNSSTELRLWQTCTVITMSTSLIIPLNSLYRIAGHAMHVHEDYHTERGFLWATVKGLFYCTILLLFLFLLLVVLSRAYLVIESFIALPNSPPSTYVIPTWSAYIPHI